jgi:hypothetical protein
MRLRVEKWLKELGLEPIVLHLQPNRGRTIIEKIEANSGVSSAIVLLSPDDEGRQKRGKKKPERCKPRARQNVILELGYFIGKLGRGKVHALYRDQKDKDLELPSDFHGVVYTAFKRPKDWQSALVRELEAAGCPINKKNIPQAFQVQRALQHMDYVSLLISSKWILFFNPPHGKKTIGFGMDNLVGEGRNKNESLWRVIDGKLEFINSEGRVFSRFVLDASQSRWTHTNDADTLSLRGQFIIRS